MSSTLSIVIPVYNERENLHELISRLLGVLNSLSGVDGQIVFVNDGSRDDTAEIILAKRRTEPRIALVDLSRNFGHQAAVSAGLAHARGDAVLVMDADLQDPPELIPQLLAKWREGFEVVYAVRRSRKEGLLKRAAYAAFYRLNRMIAKIDIPLDAGDFCLMDGRVARILAELPEYNRFVRGLRSWIGFRQTGVEYDRADRFAGTSKYSLRQLVALAVSGFVGFSTAPLRLASWVGVIAAGVGFLLTLWVVGAKLSGVDSPQGWASLLAVMLFMGGVQLIVLGVMGEYLGNVYDEVRRRPTFIVREVHGFRQAAAELPGEEPLELLSSLVSSLA